jgi:hypothetical protein
MKAKRLRGGTKKILVPKVNGDQTICIEKGLPFVAREPQIKCSKHTTLMEH